MLHPEGNIDFFISYRGQQAAWARWINWVIRSAGFSTTLMEEFEVGTTWTDNMRRAAAQSRRLIPLYSTEYWQSGACVEEFDAYWQRHLQDSHARFLLPLIVQPCTIPAMHAMLLAKPLHDLDRDAAREAILHVVRGINPASVTAPSLVPAGTPNSEPAYPGIAASVRPAPGAAPPPAPASIAWPERRRTFVPDMANREAEFDFFAETLCGRSSHQATLISADRGFGKTWLVSEFHRYGREVLGDEACCLVDFKARGTVDNLLDTVASDFGGRIPGLSDRSPARLRESLRRASEPMLFVFDAMDRATEEAREFIENHFLAEMGRAKAMRILLAGQPDFVPDPAKATWRAYARRFQMGAIPDPGPWMRWAEKTYPQLPTTAVAAIVVSAEGVPGAIANQLARLGSLNQSQLAALGIR